MEFCLHLAKGKKTQEPMMQVIPSSLQMGWSDSPAFFCGASKTACNVAEELIEEPTGLLPPHVLEPFMFPSETQSELAANLQDTMDPGKPTRKYLHPFVNVCG
jgi:hypothetical protein